MADYLVTLVWDVAPESAEGGLGAVEGVWVSSSDGRLVTAVLVAAETLPGAYEWALGRVAGHLPGAHPIGFAVEPPSEKPHFALRARYVKDDT